MAGERVALVKEKTDWELQVIYKDLEEKTQLLAEREKQIRELVEKQFALFGMVCDAAGAIASAESWSCAEAALLRFDDPEITLVKNQEIFDAIDAVRVKLKQLKGKKDAGPEDLLYEVLGVSFACRKAWERERDIALMETPGISGVGIQTPFKQHHYDQAKRLTSKISQATEWQAARADCRKFWRLYLGKLVLVENQGPGSVSEAMVTFGNALREWQEGSTNSHLRERLADLANGLAKACDTDLTAE